MSRAFPLIALLLAAPALAVPVHAAPAAQKESPFGAVGGGKEPIKIDADRLDVFDRENKAVFAGNVVAVQGDTLPAGWAEPDVEGIAGTTVPRGSLVVLGDNRPTSWDSRHYGYVSGDRLVGVVIRNLPAPTPR